MATSQLHPIIRPPEEYEHPQYPVRDETRLGPTEDLDREPDGFPHAGIAILALATIGLAAASFIMWTTNKVDDILLVIVVVPALVLGLSRWAARKRDRVHPSR